MINRILHSWSFHMKFMKRAEGSFHKISYEMTTHVKFSIYGRSHDVFITLFGRDGRRSAQFTRTYPSQYLDILRWYR